MIMPVSVCHHVSTIGQRPPPMCSWYQTHASGLIGSPTEPSNRSDERSCFCRVLRPPLHVRADRRRCRVEDVDLVALDDVPPAILVGEVRRPLVHDAGRPVAQRAVHDVAVPGDPADVGGAPVDRVGLDVEGVVVRRARRRRGSRRSCARSLSASPSCRRCRGGTGDPRRPSARRGSRTRRSPARATSGRAPPASGRRRRCASARSRSAMDGASASASSAVRLSGTVVPRRHASSCVISTSHPMSCRRPPSESAEKPPKTTVCGAPRRAHASIATAVSGTMPM